MIFAASSDPRLRTRSLIHRFFWGMAIGAVVFVAIMLVQHPQAASDARAGLLRWGAGHVVLVLSALVACIAAGVVSVRSGIVATAAGAMAMGGLAVGEAAGWVAPGPAADLAPLWLRLLLQALVLAGGLAGGILVSRVIGQHGRAAQEREARFMRLLGIAADAYWEMDAQFRLTLVSRRRGDNDFEPDAQHWGVPPWEMPTIAFESELALDAHRADLEGRRPFRDLPLRWRSPRGDVRDILVSGEPRFDARGVFLGYWGVTRDITADMHARRALRATESRHRDLFRRIPTALVLHRHGRVIDANPAAVVMFGYPDLASMLGQDLITAYEAGPSRDAARARLARLEAMPMGRGLPVQEFRLASNGRRLVARATGVRVDADGGPAILTIYHDDTDRKAAEDAVRRSEALLSHLVATSPDLITLTELDSDRYAMVNDTFTRLTGYGADEVIGRTVAEVGLWRRPGERERLVAAVAGHGLVRDLPTEFTAKTGQRLSLLVSAAGFEMDGRDYMVVNARDVTAAEGQRLEREAILNNASIGIALTRDRVFLLANPAFEQMLGWAEGSLIGQPGRVVWPDDAAYDRASADIGPALARGDQVDIEVTLARRDGGQFLCRLMARAIDLTRPADSGTVWIAEDVTEKRRLDRALADARDAAEAASRAKSAFLANTSHEIRTPLNGLVGLARLARMPELDERRRHQYLEMISDSAETLSAIISDILDLSKIEAGKLHVEALPFALHDLLDALQRGYRTIANARGLALELHADARLPAVVRGDPVRVRQILSNYLTNALKFTAQGGVQLIVGPGAGDGRVRFEVRDSGPGIDEATQARLFHPFTQADESTTRRFGGTGLGLSICRELATLMNGEVGVISRPGAGSCFWAELPLPASEAPRSTSAFGALDDDPIAGARVLMVEDNAVNMMIAVALLSQWGAEVTQASDGEQAIAAVERAHAVGQPFDAVLMDVQMPVMSGYEATAVLRRQHDPRSLPIIALTAAALTSEREAALAVGMNDFLTKPIDAHRLRVTLAAVLRG